MDTPTVYRVRWPDADGDIEVTVHLLEVAGRMECVGVDIRTFRQATIGGRTTRLARTEPRAIGAADIRSLRLAEVVAEAREKIAAFLFAPTGDEAWDATPWAAGQREKWEPKPGRPPIYGPDHFAEVARVYREAYAEGRTPTRAVARRFDATQAAAAKWVARCRSMGLLPATTQGRARSAEPNRRRKP